MPRFAITTYDGQYETHIVIDGADSIARTGEREVKLNGSIVLSVSETITAVESWDASVADWQPLSEDTPDAR